MSVTAERAIEIIHEKRDAEKNRTISVLGENGEIQVLNGRYGAYFTCNKINYKIPKDVEAGSLTFEKCQELMAAQPDAGEKKKAFGKKGGVKKGGKK